MTYYNPGRLDHATRRVWLNGRDVSKRANRVIAIGPLGLVRLVRFTEEGRIVGRPCTDLAGHLMFEPVNDWSIGLVRLEDCL